MKLHALLDVNVLLYALLGFMPESAQAATLAGVQRRQDSGFRDDHRLVEFLQRSQQFATI